MRNIYMIYIQAGRSLYMTVYVSTYGYHTDTHARKQYDTHTSTVKVHTRSAAYISIHSFTHTHLFTFILFYSVHITVVSVVSNTEKCVVTANSKYSIRKIYKIIK